MSEQPESVNNAALGELREHFEHIDDLYDSHAEEPCEVSAGMPAEIASE